MTGKRYYMTTLGDWQRHAARFATSHFIVLDAPDADESVRVQHAVPGAASKRDHVLDPAIENSVSRLSEYAEPEAQTRAELLSDRQAISPGMACHAPTKEMPLPGGGARVLALIEADEGVHLALDDDATFEALPHPLAQKPISEAAQLALAAHGVAPGTTTFDAAEAVAHVHPLLRHRVF